MWNMVRGENYNTEKIKVRNRHHIESQQIERSTEKEREVQAQKLVRVGSGWD